MLALPFSFSQIRSRVSSNGFCRKGVFQKFPFCKLRTGHSLASPERESPVSHFCIFAREYSPTIFIILQKIARWFGNIIPSSSFLIYLFSFLYTTSKSPLILQARILSLSLLIVSVIRITIECSRKWQRKRVTTILASSMRLIADCSFRPRHLSFTLPSSITRPYAGPTRYCVFVFEGRAAHL